MSGHTISHGRKPRRSPLVESSTVPIVMTMVPTSMGRVTRSPSSRIARNVAINGVRLLTAAETAAPTFAMARKRVSRPPTVPISPATAKSSRLRDETSPTPPVTNTQIQSPTAPTIMLIQAPV